MRILLTSSLLTLVLLAGCSREDAHRTERELGREAYKAKQESKKAATRAAHELHQAGKEAREGWNEAKHEPPKDR